LTCLPGDQAGDMRKTMNTAVLEKMTALTKDDDYVLRVNVKRGHNKMKNSDSKEASWISRN